MSKCMVCDGGKDSEKLFDIPDGKLAPHISSKYGGIGFRVFSGGYNESAFLEVDGMWSDGVTGFGCIIPIRFCPWCGRNL